ncbi:hypothetical protein CJJ23_02505 [Mycoplasmopsis agassizii]|uniref:Uncharacterized protein n=1 Tax=Mycoplasmopsis agassizii TaxID=33922 RepID=A0A269TIQ7_9BACT|nr:RpiB/LacA/LacB family sugar-phosphate isomerase [Mycoplasmopsis agassizii]PAK21291.1 hypothetical protein CJJ23_02505 [Mycoplasmopsis agassizii]
MAKKKIIIGNISQGLELKKEIIDELEKRDYEVVDLGSYPNEDRVNSYTTLATKMKDAMKDEDIIFGVGVCGSGRGVLEYLTEQKVENVLNIKTNETEIKTSIQTEKPKIITLGGKTHNLKNFIDALDELEKQ